jgi:thiosulfate/3-mercaptopyruvate sulfurtransferase
MNFTTLIDTQTLFQHLGDPDLVIIDCRFDLMIPDAGQTDWQRSHIPNARYAHLDHDLAAPITAETGRHPLPDIETFIKKLEQWGVTNDSQVVVYDASAGGFAVRLWWMLRWLGHTRIALLDGSWQKWTAENLPTDDNLPTIEASHFEYRADDSRWLDKCAIKTGLADHSITLVDARTEERFLGKSEPIDPIAGHISGSVNFPLQQNLDAGGCFLPAENLKTIYTDFLGDIDSRSVVHMCGSGVTACHNLLAMEHAGLSGSRLYPGSWSEWIRTESPAE